MGVGTTRATRPRRKWEATETWTRAAPLGPGRRRRQHGRHRAVAAAAAALVWPAWLGSGLASSPVPTTTTLPRLRRAIQSRSGRGTERMDEEEKVVFVLCTVWPSWPVDSCWAMGAPGGRRGGVALMAASASAAAAVAEDGIGSFLPTSCALLSMQPSNRACIQFGKGTLSPKSCAEPPRERKTRRRAAKAVCRYGMLKG